MKSFITLFAFSILLFACGAPSEQQAEANSADTAAVEVPAEKYAVTPFAPSADFPDAAITEMAYKNKKFNFGIGGTSYQLGVQTPDAPQKMCANSGQGQHIHLIVDNQPYAAKYEASFDYEIPDGEHYLLAFLSRSYHESIKTSAAHKAEKVTIKSGGMASREPVTQPMLFYSRPKGEYIGKSETEKVMLDFYLVNADLGTDYMVKAEINGEQTVTLDKWQPYYVEGLPMGDNRIKLTLVDKDGNAVDTPLNPVERVFTLKEDPAPGE